MNLKRSKKEVIFKVGRNIFLFQKIENFLKYINFYNDISSNIDDREKKAKSINRTTLGGLFENLLSPKADNTILNSDEILMTLSIGKPTSYYKDKEEVFKTLLLERNELVHHSKIKFDMTSIKKCKKLSKKLNKQSKRIKKEVKVLKNITKEINKHKNTLAELVRTNKYKQAIKTMIQENYYLNHKLVIILFKLSQNNKNNWVSLNEAGKVLSTDSLEVEIMKKEYKSLKKFLSKTELFDIKEDKNNNLFFYKIKSAFAKI